MNKERILQLADAIERESDDFAKRPWGSGRARLGLQHVLSLGLLRGTVGCIAGHALRLAGINGGFTAAAEWLGLSYIGGEGEELFFPGDVSGINVFRWTEITPAHAAAVLRRLVETGKVEWAAVLPPEMFVLPTDRP